MKKVIKILLLITFNKISHFINDISKLNISISYPELVVYKSLIIGYFTLDFITS